MIAPFFPAAQLVCVTDDDGTEMNNKLFPDTIVDQGGCREQPRQACAEFFWGLATNQFGFFFSNIIILFLVEKQHHLIRCEWSCFFCQIFRHVVVVVVATELESIK